MSEPVVLHPLAAPDGAPIAAIAPLARAIGCLEWVVADVTGPEGVLATAAGGLPGGAARPEAIAVRLRRQGVPLGWGEPLVVDEQAVLERCRARGRSSLEQLRADPSLVTELQAGSWFDAPWRRRLLRRAPGPARSADGAFWQGVREVATPGEWRRLTRTSYVALVYHRFAGELRPGQERIDIAPERFARQLRALRLAGFRPLDAGRQLGFHAEAGDRLPRRCVAITVDDAIADCVAPLLRHARWRPQLFVCTRELGGRAHWLDGEFVAGWPEIEELRAAGVEIGSHGRRHRRLTELSEAERAQELEGSLADLRRRLADPLPVAAFPNGAHDAGVSRAARAAGYRAAYTTEKGRNGAGTDPHCLRRVSVHGHDGVLAVLWKALTGEALPGPWLWLRARARR
jgi:peptidoglycan/xylan/chitin deacetylase (PgdA/CDA1 family)